MARLVRDRDGEGHYGSVVNAITSDGKVVGHEPIVGAGLYVGTVTAGTYSDRDWWLTSIITEILSVSEKEIRFKTSNSTYTFYK